MVMLLLHIIVIPFAAYLAYRLVQFALWLRRLNVALSGVPVMGQPHWLLGNLGEIRAKGGFVRARCEALNKLGVDTMKVYLGPVPILVTRDLDFFKYICNNQTNSPTPFIRVDAPMMNRMVGDTALVVSDGDIWAFHRKNLDPLFRHKNLGDIYPMVIDYCQRVEQLWLQACERNPITRSADIVIDDQMKAFSTGMIAYLAFSTDLGVLKSDQIHPMVQIFSDIGTSMEMLAMLPPVCQKISWLPERRRLERQVTIADQEMFKTIQERRKDSSESNNGHRDALDQLLDAQLSPPYTDRSIRDQCMTLYWAGQETTSLFLTWGLYYLAHDADVQQKLFEAVQDLPDPCPYDQLNRIEYLSNFVNEVLRIGSIAPSVVKQSSTDQTVYNGLQLPAGLWILQSLHDIMHDAKNFPDPLKFDPERWTDPKRHSMEAFVPFTKGEKICIGQKFALLEVKALLAYIVTKFQISEVPGFEVEPKTTFVCRPKNGMKLRIAMRAD